MNKKKLNITINYLESFYTVAYHCKNSLTHNKTKMKINHTFKTSPKVSLNYYKLSST